jgi:hypothetical protein
VTEEMRHPSFVAVSFSRCSGSPRLFASEIDRHYGYVSLCVSHATLMRGEHDDRLVSSISGDLLRIDFSEQQFAQLLTTMNVAEGVPGTLRRLHGKPVAEPPEIPSRVENIRAQFVLSLKEQAAKVLQRDLPRAAELLEKERLTKSDRTELLRMFERVSRTFHDSAPFVIEMLNEAFAERMTAAKAEFDSMMQRALHRVGLKGADTGNPKLMSADDGGAP